uniref:Sarcosine oxidasee (formaldehyde-forming) n=1 Tax=Panagrolaimus davidi TaxID=227884 RepID=A0A914QVB1_9BILA
MADNNLKPEFDVIVIGAGIVGSCAAYQLAKLGKRVALIEQFAFDNNKGSSHGGSRIFRFITGEKVFFSLIKDSLKEWKNLEKESGQELQCGYLWMGSHEGSEARAKSFKDFGIPFEYLKGKEIGEKFPQFEFGPEWAAILDPQGGALLADKCVSAVQRLAKSHGAFLRDHEPVLRIEPYDDKVEVFTSKNKYSAKKIIITAGPWLKKVLPDLKIKAEPQLMGVNYYKVTGNYDNFKTEKGSPMFLMSDLCDCVYGLPDIDFPGLIKGGIHMGIRIDADGKREFPDWMHTIPAKWFSKHIKDMDVSKPVKQVACMYTVTEDEYFIIDQSPTHPNIYIGGGFSGYGFKYAPTVGKILANLALGNPISHDLSAFSVTREMKQKSKL